MRASHRIGLITALSMLCVGGFGLVEVPASAGEPDKPEQTPDESDKAPDKAPDATPDETPEETPDEETPATEGASVHIRIVQDTGEQLELSNAALQLGVEASLVGGEHRVSLRVDALEEEQLRLRIGYHRGDTEVIKIQELKAKSKTPTELSGAGVMMSVVVVPNKPRGKIELSPDNDDPLGGLF